MLIWINGAFGAGKTQTAHELHRRVPGSHVADPELLGFAIRKMLHPTHGCDFQDLPQWRAAVMDTLLQAEAAHEGPVIVPMSIVRADYFDEIVGGLRAKVDLQHYALTASADTLRSRLHQRAAYLLGRMLGRRETWAIGQIDRCVDELADKRYATHVATDEASVDQVVETVARHAALTLAVPRLSPSRYQLRRVAVGVRHIRL